MKHHEQTEPFACHPPAFVGSTDPSLDAANAVQPNSWWVDTTSGFVIKKRKPDNSAWDTMASSTGSFATLVDALGDLLYGSTADTLSKLAGNTTTTRKFLRQTGDGTNSAAPAWDTLVAGDIPSLAASIITSGVFSEARGGTNQSTYATGDLLYASAANTLAKLAGNTTTNKKFLNQTGDGVNSAAPTWSALVAGDIPSLAASKITSGTIDTARLGSGTADASTYLRGDQTWAAVAGASAAGFTYEARSSNTVLGTTDGGKFIDATAAYTQTFDAAATLGNGWYVVIRNSTTDGTSLLVLDPNSTEQISGLTTLTMYSGEARLVMCTGSAFKSQIIHPGFARFTGNGSFVVPHGITTATVECIGGGGGGGGGYGTSAGSVRPGGSGGGGGARNRVVLLGSLLGSAGTSISVTIGSGGTSGAGGSNGAGSNGGTGGTTTFGALVSAYGGGGGFGAINNSNPHSGGGGGGVGAAGGVGQDNTSSQGGGNSSLTITNTSLAGMGGVGENGSQTSSNAGAEWGGAAGGSVPGSGNFVGGSGGSSVWGGAGGGAGGSLNTSNTERTGGAGGSVGTNSPGGGGTAGAVNGGAGGAGSAGDLRVSGQGGGGGGSQDSGTGGAGGQGGAPAGGGGGGGAGTTTGGAGGVGGAGECRVWYE